MIKKHTLFLLLFSFMTYAQDNNRISEPVTVNRVKDMAVYPGCEVYTGQKRNLISCFGNELQEDIIRYLDTEFPDFDTPKKHAKVQLEFVVSQKGVITKISPKSGDDAFKPEAVRALTKVSEYLVRKGQYIIPAKMSDGSLATLIFQNNIILNNPEYDDSDWIIYYYKKNFSAKGIYYKLRDQGINQFSQREIRKIINHYQRRVR